MTAKSPTRTVGLSVIAGGRSSTAARSTRGGPLSDLRRPDLDADALACEMARIYALNLVLDVPFDALDDPDHRVRIDAETEFTLHELHGVLCQLPWASCQDSLPSGTDSLASLLSLCVPGDADHRGPSPTRGDGQRETTAAPEREASRILSALFDAAPLRKAGPVGTGLDVPGIADPGTAEPMALWLRWIEAACGACLPFPGRADRAAQRLRTPRDLAIQVHRRHPCQAYFNAALALMSQGVGLDEGLVATAKRPLWTSQRLLSLMLDGVRRSDSLGRQRERRPHTARPGVVAARWSLMQSGEDMRAGPDSGKLAEALEMLNARAPRLLDWMARLNGALGTGGFAVPGPEGTANDGWTPVAFRQNLMLPPLEADESRLCPALGVGQAVLAGTLITLLKAVFDTRRADGQETAPARDVAGELDRMAANMALGRSVAGGFYHAENRQSLRLGQSLALLLLREALEEDGREASLDLRDFDGQALSLRARRHGCGSVRVSLRKNGAYAPWPSGGDAAAAPALAVV